MPVINVTPAGETRFVIRTPMIVHIVDDPSGSGINMASVWVRITHTDGGYPRSVYAVYAGAIQPGFIGEITGDPATVEGVTFRMSPIAGWEGNTHFTTDAYAVGSAGFGTTHESYFTTKPADCFEDSLPTMTELETKLLSSLVPFENAEKLRRLLLECCSESPVPQVRARTLMYLAAVTDMRTFLATGFDFSQVEDVLLCDRKSMLSVFHTMTPYLKYAHNAVDDLTRFSTEAKALLHKYLGNNSPVYVVNALALVIVLTAIWEV